MAFSPRCSTACSAWQRIRGFESAAAKRFAGEQGPKPEYLTVASLGVGTDVRDLPAVIRLNRLCFDYGLDLVETGNGDPLCVKYCPERPENFSPRQPFPRARALEHVPAHQATRLKRVKGAARERE